MVRPSRRPWTLGRTRGSRELVRLEGRPQGAIQPGDEGGVEIEIDPPPAYLDPVTILEKVLHGVAVEILPRAQAETIEVFPVEIGAFCQDCPQFRRRETSFEQTILIEPRED